MVLVHLVPASPLECGSVHPVSTPSTESVPVVERSTTGPRAGNLTRPGCDMAHQVLASGRIQLPLHVRWSDPPKTYDLDDRRDRALVYEQILREGTAEDVLCFIDVDELIDLWDDLVLPRFVRRAWAEWFLCTHIWKLRANTSSTPNRVGSWRLTRGSQFALAGVAALIARLPPGSRSESSPLSAFSVQLARTRHAGGAGSLARLWRPAHAVTPWTRRVTPSRSSAFYVR